MKVKAAAIIAGGASRRMGHTKALLEVDGQPLIARVADLLRQVFDDVIVVTPAEEIARAAGVPAVADVFPGKGPLAGLHAALSHFQEPVFCVACDMPHLNADFIRFLCEQEENADHDAVVPRVGAYDEPLHAIYAPPCLAIMESELARDHVGPVDNIFGRLRVRFVDAEEVRRFDPALRMFDNWNTPDDVKKSLDSR